MTTSNAWNIEVQRQTQKSLLEIPLRNRKAIARVVDKLRDDPFPSGYKKLKGTNAKYRIRAGNYRVLYTVNTKEKIIVIVRIAYRKDVYRE